MLNTYNGANLQRGETSSYPPFASASSAVRAVYAVRAVRCFVTPQNTCCRTASSSPRVRSTCSTYTACAVLDVTNCVD